MKGGKKMDSIKRQNRPSPQHKIAATNEMSFRPLPNAQAEDLLFNNQIDNKLDHALFVFWIAFCHQQGKGN